MYCVVVLQVAPTIWNCDARLGLSAIWLKVRPAALPLVVMFAVTVYVCPGCSVALDGALLLAKAVPATTPAIAVLLNNTAAPNSAPTLPRRIFMTGHPLAFDAAVYDADTPVARHSVCGGDTGRHARAYL